MVGYWISPKAKKRVQKHHMLGEEPAYAHVYLKHLKQQWASILEMVTHPEQCFDLKGQHAKEGSYRDCLLNRDLIDPETDKSVWNEFGLALAREGSDAEYGRSTPGGPTKFYSGSSISTKEEAEQPHDPKLVPLGPIQPNLPMNGSVKAASEAYQQHLDERLGVDLSQSNRSRQRETLKSIVSELGESFQIDEVDSP
jgi:hypothetical protein